MAFYIAGATGSGKSDVAIELARRCGGEIVNADAFQLYTGLDILTAKPSPEMMATIPHHLFSAIPSTEEINAAEYRERARACITEIEARGRHAIVVGGSGLYLKALTHGISDLPPSNEPLRQALAPIAREDLADWLHQLDPESARTIDLKNPRYVTRAIEICLLAGRPTSVLRNTWNKIPPSNLTGIVLTWERAELYARINQRVETMISHGVVAEVKAATPRSNAAAKAIGYREILAYLREETSLEDTINAIQQTTRQFAKRQSNWFRRKSALQIICLTPSDDACSIAEDILNNTPSLTKPPTY